MAMDMAMATEMAMAMAKANRSDKSQLWVPINRLGAHMLSLATPQQMEDCVRFGWRSKAR